MVGVRMSKDLQKEIKNWADEQDDDLPLATAIRRLVEVGLKRSKNAGRPSAKAAEKAERLAAKAIDGLVDPAAHPEEAVSRRRRLLKGPEEFREVRRDLLKG